MKACKSSTLALKLQGFFSDYLPCQRALSPHTLLSYRDSLKLLLKFVAGKKGDPSQLAVEDLTVERITTFSPSFAYLDQLHQKLTALGIPSFAQRVGMAESERESFLAKFTNGTGSRWTGSDGRNFCRRHRPPR